MIIVLYCCHELIFSLSEAINFILGPTAYCIVNELKSYTIFPIKLANIKITTYLDNVHKQPKAQAQVPRPPLRQTHLLLIATHLAESLYR